MCFGVWTTVQLPGRVKQIFAPKSGNPKIAPNIAYLRRGQTALWRGALELYTAQHREHLGLRLPSTKSFFKYYTVSKIVKWAALHRLTNSTFKQPSCVTYNTLPHSSQCFCRACCLALLTYFGQSHLRLDVSEPINWTHAHVINLIWNNPQRRSFSFPLCFLSVSATSLGYFSLSLPPSLLLCSLSHPHLSHLSHDFALEVHPSSGGKQ